VFSSRILETLKLPGEGGNGQLEIVDDGLRDVASDRVYPFINGVPNLYSSPEGDGAAIDKVVHAFYEENPFPNYEGFEDFGDIVNKGERNPFAVQLLDAIGSNKKILECGCGTGQLSHFLQLNNNHVLGIDASVSSLALAVEHKLKNNLERSSFCRMNIFDLAVKDESFDAVISHGVLHHTHDARQAFSHIASKAKVGGLIVVGLYNRYARVMTWLRSKLIGVAGSNIDYVVRNHIKDSEKARIWIQDQYYNPHETWHSIDEVMSWFEENNIEYLTCSPPILGTQGETDARLSVKTDPGIWYQRAVTQLGWIGTISREGALFDLVGVKKSPGKAP